MENKALPIGKLDSEILKRTVFGKFTSVGSDIITGPGIGEDCAVIDFGQYECVMSTDPITAAVSEIGRLSIHISCNDIASNGVKPLGIMLTVMLPPGTTEEDVARIMEDAVRTAEICGVEIIGGHTEITSAVKQPVIVSTAIGKDIRGASDSAEDMEAGDYIYMTKTAGIEGTGIIACDFEEELSEVLSPEEINEAKALLDMVSVIPEGLIGGRIGTSGMHDITEGGIFGAVWEMCNISQMGAELAVANIPVLEITKKICKIYEIDYFRLISSGCMLMIISPDKKEILEKTMAEANILCTCIGRVTEKEHGIQAVFTNSRGETERREISPPKSDELYKAVRR